MSTRLERDPARDLVREFLTDHPLMERNLPLLEAASSCTEIIRLGLEDVLISAGQENRDLYLLFAGSVDVVVDGLVVTRLKPGQTAGELELIAPEFARIATVVAAEPAVVGRITENDFLSLADRFPHLWRGLAQGLIAQLLPQVERAAV